MSVMPGENGHYGEKYQALYGDGRIHKVSFDDSAAVEIGPFGKRTSIVEINILEAGEGGVYVAFGQVADSNSAEMKVGDVAARGIHKGQTISVRGITAGATCRVQVMEG